MDDSWINPAIGVPTAWQCSKCEMQYPPDHHGWMAIRDHAENDHQVPPSKACLGVVNAETRELMVDAKGKSAQSYSPTVLGFARKNGWVKNKDMTWPGEIKKPGSATSGKQANVVSLENERVQRATVSRHPTSTMRVLAKDIAVDDTVMLLFHQAQVMFGMPNTNEGLSNFITEMVMIGAAEMGMDGAVMFMDLMQRNVQQQATSQETNGEGSDPQ